MILSSLSDRRESKELGIFCNCRIICRHMQKAMHALPVLGFLLPFAFTAMVLRWSPDGRQLAFAWNASAVRILDATAPDGDLTTRSKLVAGIGTGYNLGGSTTCHARALSAIGTT